jgi:hypothetical protein
LQKKLSGGGKIALFRGVWELGKTLVFASFAQKLGVSRVNKGCEAPMGKVLASRKLWEDNEMGEGFWETPV